MVEPSTLVQFIGLSAVPQDGGRSGRAPYEALVAWLSVVMIRYFEKKTELEVIYSI